MPTGSGSGSGSGSGTGTGPDVASTRDYSTIEHNCLRFQETGVPVAVAGTTEVAVIGVQGFEQLGFVVSNWVTGGDLDAFAVQYLFHPDGDYQTVASASGDYTTPNWPVLAASDDPTTLAGGSTAMIVLDVRGVYSVKITASANTTSTVVGLEGGGR